MWDCGMGQCRHWGRKDLKMGELALPGVAQMEQMDQTSKYSPDLMQKVTIPRQKSLDDFIYLGRLGVWGLGLVGTKGFDSVGITPWEFWCSSWEVLEGEGCGSLRGGICWWWSKWRSNSFSLVLLLCSASNKSNRFLRPCTALRWVRECVWKLKGNRLLQVEEVYVCNICKTKPGIYQGIVMSGISLVQIYPVCF